MNQQTSHSSRGHYCPAPGDGQPRIALFGHFGRGSSGNDGSLQAMLHHLRELFPNAHFICICTGPDAVTATYGIAAVPSRAVLLERWQPTRSLGKLARRLLVGIPGEPLQWARSMRMLRAVDALVVPGTGILQDADTFLGWGPYDLFRWSVAARLCRCKTLFVSMGAGPLRSRIGRFFVKTALSLADFRSYRDASSRHCVQEFWSTTARDQVFPDLAFSLPGSQIPVVHQGLMDRPTVGLGLMIDPGILGNRNPTDTVYPVYLENLATLARWLLGNGYDVRLLIGDSVDMAVTEDFAASLQRRPLDTMEGRLICEPATSVDALLRQIATTDFVVATRFHTVLFALLLHKPVVAVSFHHKCTSLMAQMGLTEYCEDIALIDADTMIKQLLQLQRSAESLTSGIAEKVTDCREALEEQYALIAHEIVPGLRREEQAR